MIITAEDLGKDTLTNRVIEKIKLQPHDRIINIEIKVADIYCILDDDSISMAAEEGDLRIRVKTRRER